MHSERFHTSFQGKNWSPGNAALTILLGLIFVLALLLVIFISSQPAQGQTYQTIYKFTGGPDGSGPNTGLTMDPAGNLYGTTAWGGTSGCDIYGCGTVFRLSPTSTGWLYTRLYSFNGADGSGPDSKVVFGPDGRLYGATVGGGRRGGGAVFGLIPQQASPSVLGSWTESMLFSFLYFPTGDILIDESGYIYGVEAEGWGSIYAVNQQNGRTVYTFRGPPDDGGGPEAGLTFDRYGNLCGTTDAGGQTQHGIVYCVSMWGDESILYNFQGHEDGASPAGVLVADQSGNLYGTASHGGSGGGGTIFMLSPSGSQWVFTLLYSFTGYAGYGGPGSLTMDAAGNLYGVTSAGSGAYSAGNVFKLTRSGGSWMYTSLHDFTSGNDGGAPTGTVLLDADGNIFGTTEYGGWFGPGCETYGCGVVWEITP